MTGRLSPGDRFSIREGTSVQVIKDYCDADAVRAINKVHIVDFRVEALKEAKKDNFDAAMQLIAKAMALDKTQCDTYTDRAQILVMKEKAMRSGFGNSVFSLSPFDHILHDEA